MTSSDPKDHPFGGIFKVLTKKDFLDRPESILSYMRDADFQKIVVNVVETLISFERRRFLLSVTCPEDELGGHVHTMSENCYLSEKVVGDIVRGIRSEIYKEPVKTRIIQFWDHRDCREALDGSAVYSMDLTELLWVNDDVTEFEIPESIKIIKECAFKGCKIQYIIIPENVERIEDCAFENCDSLRTIEVPNTILSIGVAFDLCKSFSDILTYDPGYERPVYSFSAGEVTIPKSMKVICSEFLSYNKNIREVFVPNSIQIEDLAFDRCISLEYIHLTNTLVSIGEAVFECCKSLKEIMIPDSVKTIGCCSFDGCTALKKAILSNNLNRIEDGLFRDCSSLTEINIPDSVSSIGYESFSGCTSLGQIRIPDSVEEIECCAFDECINLRTASVPADLDIENCFPETTEIIRRPRP